LYKLRICLHICLLTSYSPENSILKHSKFILIDMYIATQHESQFAVKEFNVQILNFVKKYSDLYKCNISVFGIAAFFSYVRVLIFETSLQPMIYILPLCFNKIETSKIKQPFSVQSCGFSLGIKWQVRAAHKAKQK
jgi:hypothetical protein